MHNHRCRSRNCCDLSAYENRHRKLLKNFTVAENEEEDEDRSENSSFTKEYLPKIVVSCSSEPNFPTIRSYDDCKEENSIVKKEVCCLLSSGGGGKNKFSKQHKESSLLRELLDKKRCKANSNSRRDSLCSNVSAATDIFSRNAYLNRYSIKRNLMENQFLSEENASDAGRTTNVSGVQQISVQDGGEKPIAGTYKFPVDYQNPHRKRWTLQQLKATDGIIPCQMGTNQFASQRGMAGFGAFRNTTTPVVANEAKIEPMMLTRQENHFSDAIIPLQYGTNQFSSQKGMTGFGTFRDVSGRHVHTLVEAEFNNTEHCMNCSKQ